MPNLKKSYHLFLQEDISDFEDEQIGAAVRDIHRKSRKVLNDYFAIIPVVKGEEGSNTTVAAGFNPTEIKLVGKVSGHPPFNGVIKHHGWKVSKAKFPPKAQNPSVIAPAEVEI